MKAFIDKFLKNIDIDKKIFKLTHSLKQISFDRIRCQKGRPFSNYLGFGGEKIELFPPYEFFKLYIDNPKAASQKFKEWQFEVFIKKEGWMIPKDQGGWFNGTLYLKIKKLSREKKSILNLNSVSISDPILREAIDHKVKYYFNLFESIKKRGYILGIKPIIAEKVKNLYYLINGHHRIAIMAILGYRKIYLYQNNKIGSIYDKIIHLLAK